MIFHQLQLISQLKLKILARTVREIPVLYLVLLSVFAVSASWALLRTDIAVTWKSGVAVAAIQWLICTRLKYQNNKKELLNQYPRLYAASLLVDALFATLPFLLAHIYFWLIAMAVAVGYVVFSVQKKEGIRVKQITLPSPIFVKSAYLWHAQFRVFLPTLWLFIIVIAVIARVHDNFNLAIVTYCVGIFISVTSIILQKEEPDFIAIYINSTRFRKRTLSETLVNTLLFALPLAVLLLILFPTQWQIIALSFFCVLLISIHLLWIKYIFYPSMLLASLFFAIGIFIQAVCALSPYTLPLIPAYYLLLYNIFKKKTTHYFAGNERTNY